MGSLARHLTVSDKAFEKKEYTFAFGAGVTSVSTPIDHTASTKGEVFKIVAEIPSWTNTVTAKVTMNNADGVEVYESIALDNRPRFR